MPHLETDLSSFPGSNIGPPPSDFLHQSYNSSISSDYSVAICHIIPLAGTLRIMVFFFMYLNGVKDFVICGFYMQFLFIIYF